MPLRELFSRAVTLLVIVVAGAFLIYWFSVEPPRNTAGWVGAGLAYFVWLMFLFGAAGQPLVRALRGRRD